MKLLPALILVCAFCTNAAFAQVPVVSSECHPDIYGTADVPAKVFYNGDEFTMEIPLPLSSERTTDERKGAILVESVLNCKGELELVRALYSDFPEHNTEVIEFIQKNFTFKSAKIGGDPINFHINWTIYIKKGSATIKRSSA